MKALLIKIVFSCFPNIYTETKIEHVIISSVLFMHEKWIPSITQIVCKNVKIKEFQKNIMFNFQKLFHKNPQVDRSILEKLVNIQFYLKNKYVLILKNVILRQKDTNRMYAKMRIVS